MYIKEIAYRVFAILVFFGIIAFIGWILFNPFYF